MQPNPFAPNTPAQQPANPFGPPPAQQQYPPQQQAPAYAPTYPAQQQAPTYPAQYVTPAAPPGQDQFSAPAPRVDRPRMKDIYGLPHTVPGRLLLVIPRRMQYNVPSSFKNQDGTPAPPQDRMTADVVVLDGGPLWYGGAPEKMAGRPHDRQLQVPTKIEGMYISNKGLVSQCRDAIAKMETGGVGMVLGRLEAGEAKGENEPPYLLSEFTEQDAAMARAWLAANPVRPFGQPGQQGR